ncbi:MAG: hypothetical protein KJ077_14675 [Anaerolineae bacterium]|nr:hypothetical protein [Anaerolineae bacterium]
MSNGLELAREACRTARELREAMEDIRQKSFGTRLKSIVLREVVRKTHQSAQALRQEWRLRRQGSGVKIDEATERVL